jgi:3-oxocholest-4-en-26-oyl-CoA dehydrogenase beta subunit
MDFTENENQAELAALAKKIFTERTTAARLAEIESGDDRFDPALWADLAAAGILSAALPESLGGAGLSLLEQCSVLVEAGAAVAPVPYLASIVLGAGAIARFGTEEDQQVYAAPAGRGELILTAALLARGDDLPEPPDARPIASDRKRRATGDWRLDGTLTAVPFAPLAKLILVPAAGRVFLVKPADSGVTIERQHVTSGDSAGYVTLDGVRLSADRVLGDGAAEWLNAAGTVGLCAHQAGVTARALELTAAYARTREQFGKPIGAFQAVAQRLADAYIDTEAIRLTMWQAAWRLAEGLPAATEIATAKFWAADGGHRVAHTAVHVHGGVGIDLEAETHRYFTAAKQNEFTLGGATAQLLRIGAGLAASA